MSETKIIQAIESERGSTYHRNFNKWDFLPPKIGVDLYTSLTYTLENMVFGCSFVSLLNLASLTLSCFSWSPFSPLLTPMSPSGAG